MITTDVQRKLILLRVRHLVAQLCRRSNHSRLWFYKVLRGEASVLGELSLIDELLLSAPHNPISVLREEASLRLDQVIDQAALAKRLGVSRQTVNLWESQSDAPAERIQRVRAALIGTAGPVD